MTNKTITGTEISAIYDSLYFDCDSEKSINLLASHDLHISPEATEICTIAALIESRFNVMSEEIEDPLYDSLSSSGKLSTNEVAASVVDIAFLRQSARNDCDESYTSKGPIIEVEDISGGGVHSIAWDNESRKAFDYQWFKQDLKDAFLEVMLEASDSDLSKIIDYFDDEAQVKLLNDDLSLASFISEPGEKVIEFLEQQRHKVCEDTISSTFRM